MILLKLDVFHHLSLEHKNKLLSVIVKKMEKGDKLIIQDINKNFIWKYFFAFLIDEITNPFRQVFYLKSDEFIKLLKKYKIQIKFCQVDRKYPIPVILLVCKKKEKYE